MKGLNLDQPNLWRLGLPTGIAVAVAIPLMLLALSPAQANKALALNRSSTAPRVASLNSNPVITIGVGAWLSGPGALGWAEANSVQLAISQTSAAGGVNVGGITYTLRLVTADDGCDATQAITAANTLLNAGAVAVVAHSCSSASMAAQPIYNAAGVAMISPSSTNPQVTRQGYTTTFRTITHDGTPLTLMATYFRSWLNFSRSAIVENFSWAADYYSNTFTSLGGTIVSRRVVTSTSLFTDALAAVQSENPDVIVNLYDSPFAAEAGQFSKIAYNLGMTNVVIGWSSWGSNDSVLASYASAAGPLAAEGDVVVMEFRRFADMPGWTTFLAAYQAANFPNAPNDPWLFGAFAYDATGIIIAAIDQADNTAPIAIRNKIAATKNYAGVVGTYQGFDANGDVIPQWAWLEQYRNGQWVILQPTKIYLPIVLRNFGQYSHSKNSSTDVRSPASCSA